MNITIIYNFVSSIKVGMVFWNVREILILNIEEKKLLSENVRNFYLNFGILEEFYMNLNFMMLIKKI